eukprot:COSAG01_NODE_463_length_16671_cov_192.938209_14_plen_128_part_00
MYKGSTAAVCLSLAGPEHHLLLLSQYDPAEFAHQLDTLLQEILPKDKIGLPEQHRSAQAASGGPKSVAAPTVHACMRHTTTTTTSPSTSSSSAPRPANYRQTGGDPGCRHIYGCCWMARSLDMCLSV